MVLKAIVDNLEQVDSAYRDLYVVDGDCYRLEVQPAEGFALENIEGLKNALASERTANAEAQRELKKFRDIDPDAARDALGKVDELNQIPADKRFAHRLDSLRKELTDRHNSEKSQLEGDIAKLTTQLENALVNSAATKALIEAKASADLLLPHVKRQMRLVRDDLGNYGIEILDLSGKARTDSEGNAIALGQLIEEMKANPVFARAFDGTGATGTGAMNTGGGFESRRDYSNKSPLERLNSAR